MKQLIEVLAKIKNYFFSENEKRVVTPTVLQMEAVECGAAALAIILAYYGKIIPLEELRITCGISRDGSKALNIVKAAKSYGLDARGYKLELDALKGMPLPVIIFWNFNHFLVVEGFKKNGVYLNDPASGPRTVSYEEFDKAFTGIVLTFSPSGEFKKGGEKKNLYQRLRPRLVGSELNLLYIIIASLALTIPGLIIPVFIKIFVDDFLILRISSWVIPILIGMSITALLRAVLTWLQQNQLLKLRSKLMLKGTSKFFWHALSLPMVFYQQRYAGDIAQRVDSNTRISQLITGDLAINIVNIISIIFYAALMFWYDVVLTLIGIFFASLNFIALQYIARKRKDENLKLLQDQGKLMGTTLGGISIIETIKASGGESDIFYRWTGYRAKVINSEQKLELYTRFLAVVPLLLSGLMTAIILGVGGYRVMQGDLTIGMLVAFQSLMMSFSAPLSNLVGLGTNLQTVEGDLTRLDDVYRYKIDPLLQYDKSEMPSTSETELGHSTTEVNKLAGYLELRNVTFGYSPLDPPLIENFNLILKPGSRVALIGSTGSGKSTIAKLITGINQAWSGEILFDGKPREKIPRLKMINSLAWVDQDIFLFEGTIWQNLTLWDNSKSEVEVIAAAKSACIDEIIMSRIGGYDSHVDEGGANFSGGERQRLEIARALAVNPSILIMDEATASLDPITEKIIDDNLRQKGCSCLIVAHRLSTIRDCDEIIVMEKGIIRERGTHEELSKQDGLYSRLITLEEST